MDLSGVGKHQRLGRGGVLSSDNQERQLGFIAQDVEKVFPELVYNDASDFKGLQYARLAPVLVEGLKQLTMEVRSLQETKSQLLEELMEVKRSINETRSSLTVLY